MTPFEPVDPKVSFPQLETDILAFWSDAGIFRRSLEVRKDAPEWIFYEGPPTTNGKPGIHHVESRTFKDVYPRFKTMTGHKVQRKAGWDCHGLPVEIEVEKEIGTTGKRDIEAFGVAEFNARCRESVGRYVNDWERLTDRIGFWIDLSNAYRTMDTEYIESVWWSLKHLHERGLLVEADRVAAYCPRCGTALSDAEVALGYRTVEDPSLYLRFPIVESRDASLVGASLVGWTTTPWTLPSNTGLAVDRDAAYVELAIDGERAIVADELKGTIAPATPVLRELPGSALIGARYQPPYPNVEGAHVVVHGDFVTMDTGTGVVHIAPAFGADDLAAGRENGWPVFKPVDDAGRFNDLAPASIRGMFVKDADATIIEDLRDRDVLVRAETYEHNYPFCWRCGTPLLYYARSSWYARTTAVKERLLEVNENVTWFPEHIKHGRYGNWLENNVDWAISRERYWGTPLPIWRCGRGHATVVGSLAELGRLAGRDLAGLDPHRPGIDEVTIPCPRCDEHAHRVPEVIDAWYDSGAMPFAQWGYHPEMGRGLEEFEGSFPADFISEAIDQTRGWFYTLMAEGVLHFDQTAYRNVVCLGLIVAEDGRKMSKSVGNVFDPWEALDRQGADALRWFMITNGSPWSSRRIGHAILDDVLRQFLLTLWNVYAFFVTYANADGFDPSSPAPPAHERPAMDRWILSQLQRTVAVAREGLESYDATRAGRRIEAFVGDLSNWYVRRSRRRFWNPGGSNDEDAAAAFHTLHECLVSVATLLAPLTPFVAEELWRNLAAGRDGRPESVHLADYPECDLASIDTSLDRSMATARQVVELGRRVRVETKTKTRQPLGEAVLHVPGRHEPFQPLLDTIAAELNVKRVAFAGSTEVFGRWRAKPSFKTLGPRLGPKVKEVASALAADHGALATALANGEPVTVAGTSIGPDDVDLVQEVTEGWGVASDGGVTVALDLEITQELAREGIAREVMRLVQDVRRAAGLDVSDRIVLSVKAGASVAEAIEHHRDQIAAETLATEMVEAIQDPAFRQEAEIDGADIVVTVARS